MRTLTIFGLIVLFQTAFGQIDMTKYASDDLFAVKPVIEASALSSESKPKQVSSWYELELEKADAFWKKGELDEAAHIYESLLQDNPESAALHYYLGVIHYQKEKYEDALAALNTCLQKEALFLEARYIKGLIFVDQKDYKAAKAEFSALEDVSAYRAAGLYGSGLIQMNYGNAFGAYAHFKKCIQTDSTFRDAYMPMISMDLYLNKTRLALNTIEKALKVDPKWEEMILARGILSTLETNKTDQLEQDIHTLVSLAPTNYHYLSLRGFMHLELGNYRDAVLDFEKAYDLKVDSVQRGEYKFSSTMSQDRSIQQCLSYYRQHFKEVQDIREFIDRGICAWINNERSTALQLLDSANMARPSSVTYTLMGAINQSTWNREDVAIEHLTKAIEIDTTNWIAVRYRGELYLKTQQVENAYTDFNTLIKLRPRDKTGYINRSVILIDAGYYEHANKDLSIALSIDPTDTDIHFNRAITNLNLKRYADTEFDIHQIIKKKPKDGEAYYLLSQAELQQKDSASALIHLDSASKFSRYKLEYHKQLIDLATALNHTDACMAGYDRLVKYDSYNKVNLLNRGRFLLQTKQYEASANDLLKFLKFRKDSGEGHYLAAQALSKLGNDKDAAKHLERSQKLGYQPPKAS